ncbi:23733_t:CDS:2, partial [Gigaspora margarita]
QQPSNQTDVQAIDHQVIPITKEPGPVDPCFLCGIKISSDSKKRIDEEVWKESRGVIGSSNRKVSEHRNIFNRI